MSENIPTLRLESPEGQLLLREGLSISFYLRHSHDEVAPAVLRSLELYQRTVWPRLAPWFKANEEPWRRLDATGWEHLRHKLLEEPWPDSGRLTVCDEPDSLSAYQFEYHGKRLASAPPDAVCAARFWLPTEYLLEYGPSQVRALALELAAPLPFSSGHASLAFHTHGSPSGLHSLRLRYPGLDLTDLENVSWHLGPRVRGAHWLTFLGPPVLAELSGTDGLRSRLSSPDISVQAMDGGRALVTLDRWPAAGDTEQGRDLPLHRELAHVLGPWLYEGAPPVAAPQPPREHLPRTRVYAPNDQPLVREGLSICFYLRHSHAELEREATRTLDTYLHEVGPEALGWYVDPEGDMRELDTGGWEHLRRELREQPSPRLLLRSSPGGAERYRFEYIGRQLDAPSPEESTEGPVSALAVWLPTEYLERQGPERFRQLALELAGTLPFDSGHAGPSFNSLLSLPGTLQALPHECLRYPGMDIFHLQDASWDLGTRVKGAHWLTFLGPPLLAELGGTAGLRSRLSSPDISVRELEGGRAVLTLGECPDAGDTEQGRGLPSHRELARVLEPWLYLPRVLPPFTPGPVRRWARRFLE